MKYPFVKQSGLQDCGVASMLMIMKYHNFVINSEILRNITKTSKEGTTAYHMIEAFYKYGFDAKGFKCEMSDLEEKITLPIIAHTKINDVYFHFLVVYKINKKNKTITIADPSDKIKTISYEEFGKIWTKTIITITPVLKFQKQKSEKILVNIIKSTKLNIKQLISTSLIITVLAIINSYYFMHMMNKGNLTYLFIIVVLVKIGFEIIRNNYLIKVKHDLDLNITNETFTRIIDLPYRYYANRTTGEVISRVNDLELVKTSISKLIFIVFLDLPLTLIASIFLIKISSHLFISASLIYLLYILVYFLFSKRIKEKIKELQEEKEQLNSFMTEMVSSYETIKSQSLEKKTKEKFKILNRKYLLKIKKFDFLLSSEYHLKELVAGISSIVIIYIGFKLVNNNLISLSELITFNTIMFFFLEPIKNVIEMNSEIKETISAIKRIEELFFKEDDINVTQVAGGDIKINNLYYTYDDSSNVINDFSVEIKSGEKVMIYGKSGIGKSTLLKILMKYLDDFKGEVLINGKCINTYNINHYKEGISYISQKEVLFNDTIINNMNSKNLEKIDELKKICQLEDFFSKNDINKVINENSYNISGGERQRLVLMRALLKEFNILIIDEGLSEVDVETEKNILEKLFEMCKDKTIIIVSHRLDNKTLFTKVCNV